MRPDKSGNNYKINHGDTLHSVARVLNINVVDLAKNNDMDVGCDILPGQYLLLDDTVETCIDKLFCMGAINNPGFWKVNSKDNPYLMEMIINSAKRIVKVKYYNMDIFGAIGNLIRSNIITTPGYWLELMTYGSGITSEVNKLISDIGVCKYRSK